MVLMSNKAQKFNASCEASRTSTSQHPSERLGRNYPCAASTNYVNTMARVHRKVQTY